MNDILEFQGPHRWLSNFWPAPVVLDGVTYPSVEHAYQAAKFSAASRPIFTVFRAGEAKRMGKAQPADWVERRVDVMRALIQQKFAPHTEFAEWLLKTGDVRIIEGNAWGDQFWGVSRGRGLNTLGKLIMEQREHLRGVQE